MGSRIYGPALALVLTGCATPRQPTLDQFEAALAAQDSATAALTRWCAAHHFADPPLVTARPVQGRPSPPPAEMLRLLEAAADEPLGYRHVRLTCGETVLSEAHNWYLPGRLPPEMNRALETSDTPFGKVIAPLGFRRDRLASLRGAAPGCPDGTILSHRALIRLTDGRPVSLVVECYTAANLAARASARISRASLTT